MFRKPNYVTREDIQLWQLDAIKTMLAPLTEKWPTIHSKLVETYQQKFDPNLLGNLLVSQLTQMIEKTEQAYRDEQWKAVSQLREQKDKVIEEQKKRIESLSNGYRQLSSKNNELELQIQEKEKELNGQSLVIKNLQVRLQAFAGVSTRR